MSESKGCNSSGKVSQNIFGKAVLAQQAQILFNWVNMVRAGVVNHPREWGRFSGYNELQEPRRRYSLIDHGQLAALLGMKGIDDLIDSHAAWVEEAWKKKGKARDIRWTENISVGSKEFVERIKEKLGALFLSRKVEEKDGIYELHDPQGTYTITENSFPWRDL